MSPFCVTIRLMKKYEKDDSSIQLFFVPPTLISKMGEIMATLGGNISEITNRKTWADVPAKDKFAFCEAAYRSSAAATDDGSIESDWWGMFGGFFRDQVNECYKRTDVTEAEYIKYFEGGQYQFLNSLNGLVFSTMEFLPEVPLPESLELEQMWKSSATS